MVMDIAHARIIYYVFPVISSQYNRLGSKNPKGFHSGRKYGSRKTQPHASVGLSHFSACYVQGYCGYSCVAYCCLVGFLMRFSYYMGQLLYLKMLKTQNFHLRLEIWGSEHCKVYQNAKISKKVNFRKKNFCCTMNKTNFFDVFSLFLVVLAKSR